MVCLNPPESCVMEAIGGRMCRFLDPYRGRWEVTQVQYWYMGTPPGLAKKYPAYPACLACLLVSAYLLFVLYLDALEFGPALCVISTAVSSTTQSNSRWVWLFRVLGGWPPHIFWLTGFSATQGHRDWKDNATWRYLNLLCWPTWDPEEG